MRTARGPAQGQIRQSQRRRGGRAIGTHRRFVTHPAIAVALGFVAATCLLPALGCGKKPSAKAGKEKTKPEAEEKKESVAQIVNLGPGNGLVKSAPPERKSLWFVEWDSARIDVVDSPKNDLLGGGRLERVRGYLFDEGKPGSTFRGDRGVGDKEKKTLTLRGNVHVVAPDKDASGKKSNTPAAELTCDQIVYDAEKKVIRALGHVKVTGEIGTIGTLSEVWATPDLNRIATPDMFDAK